MQAEKKVFEPHERASRAATGMARQLKRRVQKMKNTQAVGGCIALVRAYSRSQGEVEID